MKDIFCPNCGQAHKSEGKFCEYCGNNLEKAILQFKQDQLPIRYQEADRVQTYQQGPTGQQEAVRSGRGSRPARFFSILFMIGAVVLLLLFFYTDYFSDFLFYILIGTFGIFFLFFSLISAAVNPRRNYRRGSYCYGPCYCSGNECDGCDACGSGCGDGCDCGDCGDCGCGDCGDCGCGDCGDCGCGDCGGCDCGGCDLKYGGLGFLVGLFYVLFSRNKKKE